MFNNSGEIALECGWVITRVKEIAAAVVDWLLMVSLLIRLGDFESNFEESTSNRSTKILPDWMMMVRYSDLKEDALHV